MYKMIIADNESAVHKSIKNSIVWEDFDIEVIAEAFDGQETFDLCQRLQPDILITDIHMLIADDLELSCKLKEYNINTNIIIVSSIQDFNHPKAVLSINAAGYILKPVKSAELVQVIKKVINKIKFEQDLGKKLSDLKKELNESMSFGREKFLYKLVRGFYINNQEIKEKLEYLNIPITFDQNLKVCVLQIDSYQQTVDNNFEGGRQLLNLSIVNIIEEILICYTSAVCFTYHENEFLIIFYDLVLHNEEYNNACVEIISYLEKFLNVPASIGVGYEVHGISQINSSYSSATRALQYRSYTGTKSILDINDIENINEINENSKHMEYLDFFELQNQFVNYMKLGNCEGVQNIINHIFNNFIKSKNFSMIYIQNVCTELVYAAYRAIIELGENIDILAENRLILLENICKPGSVNELRNYLLPIFLRLTNHFSRKYMQKNDMVVKKIKDFINQRYMFNISITKISEWIYLTPNYISLIFKKESGETIIEYLTRVRMEAAKELLSTTDFKVLEIAEMVGYENPHYFSTVFKKYAGIHPLKHRCYTLNNQIINNQIEEGKGVKYCV